MNAKDAALRDPSLWYRRAKVVCFDCRKPCDVFYPHGQWPFKAWRSTCCVAKVIIRPGEG